MRARELLDLQSMLREQEIVFAYSGYMTETILSGVGDAVKRKLVIEDANTKTIRSVFAVFVEQMQNIIRYSAEVARPEDVGVEVDGPDTLRYGILTIGRSADGYVVHAGNLVAAENVERIRERLEHIQSMDKDGLKALYKERLKGASEASSKGAGIGLIEIARRASKPLDFDLTRVDESHSFFALKATI